MIEFAQKYINDRIQTYTKDMEICLTPNAEGNHAYFPALLASLSFLDLFSCLKTGDLEPRGMQHVLEYSKSHLPKPAYDEFNMTLLWHMYRHKTVHTSQPYGTFDTYARQGVLRQKPRMKVTWQVSEEMNNSALSLQSESGTLQNRAPWPTPHTHRLTVYLPQLQHDLISSVDGPGGYLDELKEGNNALDRFTRCMEEIFPK
ncbi:MAG: hypothetical protein ABW130_19325 [Candidatus Thiodiazotropha lotti]